MDLERNLRRLATVPRWAVVSTIKQQSVAEHTFHTMWICRWLYYRVRFAPLQDKNYDPQQDLTLGLLLELVLDHDAEEAITGDVPSPSKPPSSLTAYSKAKCILKLADILEALLFIREEQEFGNRSMKPIFDNLIQTGDLWVHRARHVGLLKTPMTEVLLANLWAKVRPDRHPALIGDDDPQDLMLNKGRKNA